MALELVHHWWRVALVYLAGVAAGSMGTSITNPRIYLAGASGGVYALITAHIATIIMVSPQHADAILNYKIIANLFVCSSSPIELVRDGVRHRAAVCVLDFLRD